jgi:hypothetical protein
MKTAQQLPFVVIERSPHKQYASSIDPVIDKIVFTFSKTLGADTNLNWRKFKNSFKWSNCSFIVISFPCIFLKYIVSSFAVGSRPDKTIQQKLLGLAFCLDSWDALIAFFCYDI